MFIVLLVLSKVESLTQRELKYFNVSSIDLDCFLYSHCQNLVHKTSY